MHPPTAPPAQTLPMLHQGIRLPSGWRRAMSMTSAPEPGYTCTCPPAPWLASHWHLKVTQPSQRPKQDPGASLDPSFYPPTSTAGSPPSHNLLPPALCSPRLATTRIMGVLRRGIIQGPHPWSSNHTSCPTSALGLGSFQKCESQQRTSGEMTHRALLCLSQPKLFTAADKVTWPTPTSGTAPLLACF